MCKSFKMKRIFFLLIAVIFSLGQIMAQDKKIDKLWQKANEEIKKQLPKTAVKTVDEILELAKSSNDIDQIIKATYFKSKLVETNEEDHPEKEILRFEKEYNAESNPILKAVYANLLGKLYTNYLNRNRYAIQNRTNINDDSAQPNDIKTFSIDKLIEKVNYYYLASVKDKEALRKSCQSLKEILAFNPEMNISVNDDIYSILLFSALQHFQNTRFYVTEPAYKFVINQDVAFGKIEDFVNHKFETKDTNAYALKVVQLYQESLSYYQKIDQDILIKLNLERLKFMNTKAVVSNKNQKYKDALIAYQSLNSNHQLCDLIKANLLDHYVQELDLNNTNAIPSKYRDNALAQTLTLMSELKGTSLKFVKEYVVQIEKAIKAPFIKVQLDKVVPITNNSLIYTRYKNVNELHFKVVKGTKNEISDLGIKISEGRYKDIKRLKIVKEWSEELPIQNDFKFHSIESVMNKLPSGNYFLLAMDAEDFKKSNVIEMVNFYVSNIAYQLYSRDGKHQLVVVDRNNGLPISNANVELYHSKYNYNKRVNEEKQIGTYKTDEEGFLEFTKATNRDHRNLVIKVSNGKDFLKLEEYTYLTRPINRSEGERLHIFTDRAIYRPGQKVYFKGMQIHYDKNRIPSISARESITVSFKDANRQPIGDLQLTLDEYGACNGSFVIPENILNGNFILDAGKFGSQYIKVEEYKRPTFYVECKDSKQEFVLGDEVSLDIEALTYAGIPLEEVTCNYTVYRTANKLFRYNPYCFDYRSIYNPQKTLVKNGATQINENGVGTVSFIAEADPALIEEDDISHYSFLVEIDVTDINGETKSTSKMFNISNSPYSVYLSNKEYFNNTDTTRINISVNNCFDKQINKKGNLLIYKYAGLSKNFIKKHWPLPEHHSIDKMAYNDAFPFELYDELDLPTNEKNFSLLKEIPFNTAEEKSIALDKLQEGFYKVKVSINNVIDKEESYFQVYKDKPVGESVLKIKADKTYYSPNDVAKIKMVSNYQTPVFYRVNRMNDSDSYDWSSSLKDLEIPITENDYGNINIEAFYVVNNRFYSSSITLIVPWSNKHLDVKYTTFRDKIEPGAKEKWSLEVTGLEDGKAQIMTTMYDASLDEFATNNWRFDPFPTNNNNYGIKINAFGNVQSHVLGKYSDSYFKSLGYSAFPEIVIDPMGILWGNNAHGGRYDEVRIRGYSNTKQMRKSGANEEMMMESSQVMVDGVSPSPAADVAEESDGFISDQTNGQSKNIDDVPVRTNLDETVFFYPNLETDDKGKLSYEFTMNEAITKWNVLTLAHDKDLRYGFDKFSVVTKKELLIVPNIPRFLRAGDSVDLSAKVSNLAKNALSIDAKIVILNAISEEDITRKLVSNNQLQTLQLDTASTKLVSWEVNVPDDLVMPVVIKVIAKSDKHTDGEQNMLPVLTNRKLVTSTKAMMVRANEEKTFSFDHFKENFDSDKLASDNFQVEFTTNPAWFAIKAMPYLKEVNVETITYKADRLYVNAIANSIIEKYPKIKEVFDEWKNDPEALKSELEKNSKFKEVLLTQTPWVRNAQSEAQQRRDIALLFDINKLATDSQNTIDELRKLQLPNGGFSWCPGGRDNWYITQYVLENLAKLKSMDLVEYKKLDRVINKALKYSAKSVEKYYFDLKSRYKDSSDENNLNAIIVQYAYISSVLENELFEKVDNKVSSYFISQMEKYWVNTSPYLQAMIGTAFYRSGRQELAFSIKKSLEERKINNTELGTYWKTRSGYRWYNSDIAQQAMLIEFFENVDKGASIIDDMKMYLLTKKQTTHWESSKSTVNAVFALLYNTSEWLNDNQKIEVSIANELLNITDKEAGTGYFKKGFSSEEINRNFENITVSNPNKTIVWGAAYWQYWQDLDLIKSADENPFNIVKNVYKEIKTDTGVELLDVDENTKLNQGDKLIIRVELRTDRDLDYVHMRDMRSAGLEPMNVVSRYKWQDRLGYYETTKDQSTDFFFSSMRRGTYVFEYPLRVTHKGTYSNGITTAQCMYAPSFAGHSKGERLRFQ